MLYHCPDVKTVSKTTIRPCKFCITTATLTAVLTTTNSALQSNIFFSFLLMDIHSSYNSAVVNLITTTLIWPLLLLQLHFSAHFLLSAPQLHCYSLLLSYKTTTIRLFTTLNIQLQNSAPLTHVSQTSSSVKTSVSMQSGAIYIYKKWKRVNIA